jgi:hypothetical protein
LAKAYEEILVDRIVVFLEANGRFDQNTNGSRKGRSAVGNAMLVQMAAELVILDGGKLLGVFLDERKCCPTAIREGNMWALLEAGVEGDIWHAMGAMQEGLR